MQNEAFAIAVAQMFPKESRCFRRGYRDRAAGKPSNSCPYNITNGADRDEWLDGYNARIGEENAAKDRADAR